MMRPTSVSYSERGVQVVAESIWLPIGKDSHYFAVTARYFLPPVTRPVIFEGVDLHWVPGTRIGEAQYSWLWADREACNNAATVAIRGCIAND